MVRESLAPRLCCCFVAAAVTAGSYSVIVIVMGIITAFNAGAG